MRSLLPGLAVALVVAAAPLSANAGGFELAQQGAAAAGVGHAGVAGPGDGSAAWFNPAAIADGGGLRATVGISLGGSTVRATGDGWEGQTDNPLSTPPYAYVSFSNAWWGVGVTANLAFAGGVRWPEDWEHRFDIIQSSPRFLRTTAFFAFRVGPVSFAAGPHLDYGQLSIRKATDHVGEQGSAHIALRGLGVGVDVSALFRLGERVDLGATYRSRTVLALSGEADFDVPTPFQPRFPDQAATSRMVLPDRIAVGVGIRPKGAERLRILTEASLTLWSVNQELAIDFEDEVTTDTVVRNDWRPTMALRGGVEVRVHERVMVRGGLYLDGLWGGPPPPDTLSPSSPDSTRLGLTAGARIDATDWLAFDLFYEHIELLPRTSTGHDAPIATYRGFANLGGVSVSLAVPLRPEGQGAGAGG